MNSRALAFIAGIIACSAVVKAQSVYEPFNYTLGDSLTSGTTPTGTGISGWTSTGTDTFVSGLSYNSLSTAGNAVQLTTGSADITATLTTAPTTTFYLSFLAQVNTNTGYAGLSLGNVFNGFGSEGTGDWWAGATIDSYDINAFSTSISVSDAQTYLFVTKYSLTPDGGSFDEVVTSWIGTDGGSSQNLTLLGSFSQTVAASTFNTIAIDSDANPIFDELRIGGTEASVLPGFTAVPEPSSYALVGGLAVLGFLALRDLRHRRLALA